MRYLRPRLSWQIASTGLHFDWEVGVYNDKELWRLAMQTWQTYNYLHLANSNPADGFLTADWIYVFPRNFIRIQLIEQTLIYSLPRSLIFKRKHVHICIQKQDIPNFFFFLLGRDLRAPRPYLFSDGWNMYNREVLVCTVNVYIPAIMGWRPILRYQLLHVP